MLVFGFQNRMLNHRTERKLETVSVRNPWGAPESQPDSIPSDFFALSVPVLPRSDTSRGRRIWYHDFSSRPRASGPGPAPRGSARPYAELWRHRQLVGISPNGTL